MNVAKRTLVQDPVSEEHNKYSIVLNCFIVLLTTVA